MPQRESIYAYQEGEHHMKHIAYLLVTVAMVAGIVAYMAPASGHDRWRVRPDLRNQNAPRIPRL